MALALTAALLSLCGNSAHASVHVTYSVGQLTSVDDYFSASWLHDASKSPANSGSIENRAYRMGAVSDFISGSLYGDFDATTNQLRAIGGTLSGKASLLLGDLSLVDKTLELKLGKEAGTGKSGAIQFETNGAGNGEFTGGYVDFALTLDGAGSTLLTGTFFFKPQAETGSAMLSPNRGNSSAFTLWGYNWMHDSADIVTGVDGVNWLDFLQGLGFSGDALVSRNSAPGQTLGIALFASDADFASSAVSSNPEPTAGIIWGVLIAMGAVVRRRRAS